MDPTRFFSWTVVVPESPSPGLGALGVTGDYGRAIVALSDELRAAPYGARGLVHKVMLSFTRPGYLYEALVARGWFDAVTCAVVWETLPNPGGWGLQLYARVTDPREAIGDAFPPEAIAAGLADYEAEQGRQQWA